MRRDFEGPKLWREFSLIDIVLDGDVSLIGHSVNLHDIVFCLFTSGVVEFSFPKGLVVGSSH